MPAGTTIRVIAVASSAPDPLARPEKESVQSVSAAVPMVPFSTVFTSVSVAARSVLVISQTVVSLAVISTPVRTSYLVPSVIAAAPAVPVATPPTVQLAETS